LTQRIAILGAGESGTGSAVLAKAKGFDVFVSDKGKIADKYKAELDGIGVQWEEGNHTAENILNANEVIKSPGIPDTVPLVLQLKEKNIPVISEIEFAARYTKAKLHCITGTNGKTTTASLTYHILQKAGLNVGLGGNIGQSFARQVATADKEHYVLELSSFQLDNTYTTHATNSVICNITPDHLDRYNYELQGYVNSKFRITQNQTETNLFIYCADDDLTTQNLNQQQGNAQLMPFSIKKKLPYGAWLQGKEIIVKLTETDPNPFIMLIEEFSLKGKHNIYNTMASAIIAKALNIRKEVIRDSLTDFRTVEHRLENIGKVRGIDFINDSKATNVNSAWYALESVERPVIWIAGGVDKGNDYTMLKPLVKERVKLIICLGVDNRKIHEAFGKDVKMLINTGSMAEAVHVAYKMADKGDTVLLSPACASFDLFENYEDRGRQFKRFVKNL
jgi:UDP-N-acetylmuramoylalanine--D-glutamate ligase